MKAASHISETDQTTNSSGMTLDPFAVDFFGGKNTPTPESAPHSDDISEGKKRLKTKKWSDWHKNLRRLTNTEAKFSFLLQNLPDDLTENAAQTIRENIAHYTFRQSENVQFSRISVSEINLNESIKRTSRSPKIFLTLGCQPDKTPAIVAINAEFARSIIDFILGGQGAETENLQAFSPIENTILEFLAVKILSEINKNYGEPLLCLQSVRSETDLEFENYEHGAEIVFSLELDGIKGIISLFAPEKFLHDLDRSQNPLFLKKTTRKKLSDFEKFVPKLDMRLQIGTTILDAESLLYLEPDDIILIEQPQVIWKNANFTGGSQIFVGHGKKFRFRGTLVNNVLSGEQDINIGEIISEETRQKFIPAKFKMDEKEIELEEAVNLDEVQPAGDESDEILDEQLSPSLENVQVALRVEIAGNKLSLRDLQNLRAGQIIALGCRPTDPVRLVADHNEEPLATGELVEIEGQLGVRLTKVFI